MARPKKKGVDYFPHDCITGKTIFILEQKFGNDGYAFWFKLLEFIGTKEGHYLDCNDPEDMEFLQAKTHLSGVIICSILDLLSNMRAIDRELWEKKIVWSQKFVDNISDVYLNRRIETPRRPSFYIVSTDQNPATLHFSAQPTLKSTQSKVKESKVNEIETIQGGEEEGDENDNILKKNNNMSKKKTEPIELPFQEKEFREIWDEWIQDRKDRRIKAYSPIGLKRALNKLVRESGNNVQIAIEMIDEAISSGWQGFHPLKNKINGTAHQRPVTPDNKSAGISEARIKALRDY